jgi:hypothetical protein
MRVPRPAPATLIAIAALILAAGGLAVAAIPGSDGTIHACYKKSGGSLRVVKGTQCRGDERPLTWNQGVDHVRVRSGSVKIHLTCNKFGGNYICGGSATNTVRCKKGERATGGGYGSSNDRVQIHESKPDPLGGTPDGWKVSASSSTTGTSPAVPDETVPIHVVCAD